MIGIVPLPTNFIPLRLEQIRPILLRSVLLPRAHVLRATSNDRGVKYFESIVYY